MTSTETTPSQPAAEPDDLDCLRAAHEGWEFRRNDRGQIECRLGRYTYFATGIADAGVGVVRRKRELAEGDANTVITGHTF